MICRNCGKQFEGNFCPVCGKPVSNEDRANYNSAQNSRPITRSSDTRPSKQNLNTSPVNSGQEDTSSGNPPLNTPNINQTKKKKIGCLPIIGIIVVLFMACSIMMGGSNSSSSSKSSETKTSNTSKSETVAKETKEIDQPTAESASDDEISNELSDDAEPDSETDESTEFEQSSDESDSEETPEEDLAKNQDADEKYQSILDEYTIKIQEATPGLIEEYKAESKDNTSGLTGLAEIANSKVAKLAEINNEGIGKMAEVMLKQGSGSYSEYESWAGKLMDVYMEESQKIMDVYMNSAL